MAPSFRRHIAENKFFYLYAGCMAGFVALAALGYLLVLFQDVSLKEKETAFRRTVVSDIAYIDMPRIQVSVGSGGAQMAIDLSLEVMEKDMRVLQGYQPQIADRLNIYFSKISPEQLGTPLRRDALRRDLLIEVNKTHAPFPIRNLHFRQVIVR